MQDTKDMGKRDKETDYEWGYRVGCAGVILTPICLHSLSMDFNDGYSEGFLDHEMDLRLY